MPEEKAPGKSLLRARGGHTRVTYIELFFDLVFVFAVTQLSHALLHHLTLEGLAETAFLTLTVWWVWIYTSWATNWLDPQATLIRLVLIVLMAAGLVLSSSIPEAFRETGLSFAGAYVFMQLVRTAVLMFSLRGNSPANYRNFQRIFAWLLFASIFWIAGGFAEHGARWALWGTALLIDVVSPALSFWVPGLGRSSTTDWDISPDHFAERCALFVIIALGESLLVTGATFAGLQWTPMTIGAFAAAFGGAVTMWWIYFSVAENDATFEFEHSDDPGRIARLAYTYCHVPLITGIILTAVGDELVLAHPGGHVEMMAAIAILGGPAIFLFGNLMFKRILFEEFLLSHIAGLVAIAALIAVVPFASPVLLSAATTGVLLTVGVWENIYAARWKKQHPDWRAEESAEKH
jgi:low temperature requirement protein LtrA